MLIRIHFTANGLPHWSQIFSKTNSFYDAWCKINRYNELNNDENGKAIQRFTNIFNILALSQCWLRRYFLVAERQCYVKSWASLKRGWQLDGAEKFKNHPASASFEKMSIDRHDRRAHLSSTYWPTTFSVIQFINIQMIESLIPKSKNRVGMPKTQFL